MSVTNVVYSFRDGNRDRWNLDLSVDIITDEDYVWNWTLTCENGTRLSGTHTGQYDHVPSIADILVPAAQAMVSTAVDFSCQGKVIKQS